MADEKWDQYAQLVLKGLENSEACGKEHEARIQKLENTVNSLSTIVKIFAGILIPLILDAIRSYFAGG